MKSNQELNQILSEAVSFVDATRSEYAGKKVMPADVEARFDKAVADMLDAKKELELRSQIDNARSFQMAEGNNPSIMGGVAQDSKQEDALVRAWRGYLRGDNSQLGL